MTLLKALIIDDEYYARVNLNEMLNSYCPEIKVVGKTGSVSEAKKLVYNLKPDVLFLDIEMPKLSGFEFLESLTEKNFMIVFVSAYQEYGVQAVKVNAVDFLVKPVSIKELQGTVKKLVEINSQKSNQNQNRDKIVISQFQGFTIIDVINIIKLVADDNYTTIYLKDKNKITVSKTLKYFEDILPKNEFIRIHRSEIINILFLKEISYADGGTVIFKDGTKGLISKGKLHYLIEKVKNHSISKI